MAKSGFRILLPTFLLVIACATAGAGGPKADRYPLRIHVLAADQTYQTARMNPAESVVCDSIDDMLSSISPNPGGPITLSGVSADPCSLHADMIAGRFLDINTYERVFSGAGRGDVISPPSGTQGLSFHYENCPRVRVLTGFQSLPARWKKPGQRLEVLVPSDDVTVKGEALPPMRCVFTVTLHDSVYLLLRNGKLIEVPQEEYWKKPALRVFLSGNTPTVQQRMDEFTVSARHPQ
jgi:hypothetical protein